jgi:retron-type reverse transcriptase
MWAYKLDIHNYFNSISIPLLLPILRNVLANDPALYAFFERMLTDQRAMSNGEVVTENRGVMAGTPTSPFLANIYLSEVDRHFADAGVIYARYSDDMILFAPDRATLEEHITTLADFLGKYRLQANPDKERIYAPGQAWDFLGFKCLGRSIDIADATRRKMQDKIRRKAHALLRWRLKENVPPEAALRAMIRHFNAKFFEGDDPSTLTWSRWFFPLLTQADGLRQIDRYLQDQLRFLATGRHVKKNFSIRYGMLKSLGYRSLVHEYYASRDSVQDAS